MFEFHLNVKTMTYMAMFAALQLVLEFLTQFTPSMPQGGNVAFSLIAIFLCSYLMGPIYGVIVGLVCCGLHFALGFATFYGPLSVIFDYVLHLGVCGLAGMFKDIKRFPIGIVICMVIKTISHLISGWYAFHTPLAGNLAYNLPYNIATCVTCVILYMIIKPSLSKAIHLH